MFQNYIKVSLLFIFKNLIRMQSDYNSSQIRVIVLIEANEE